MPYMNMKSGFDKEDIEKFRPYIGGIVASIETINKELHGKVCPDKKIEPYEEMLSGLDKEKGKNDLKKSITIVIGLGESDDDKKLLMEFIKKHK